MGLFRTVWEPMYFTIIEIKADPFVVMIVYRVIVCSDAFHSSSTDSHCISLHVAVYGDPLFWELSLFI